MPRILPVTTLRKLTPRLVVSNAGREGIAHAMRSLRAVDATLASRTPYYRVDGQDLTG